MFYHDKRGTLRSISRDSYPQNIHFFDFNDVPNMPDYLRSTIEKMMVELREEYRIANPPSGMLF